MKVLTVRLSVKDFTPLRSWAPRFSISEHAISVRYGVSTLCEHGELREHQYSLCLLVRRDRVPTFTNTRIRYFIITTSLILRK